MERDLELHKSTNAKLSILLEVSLKQNEADLIMAKKNADLSKHHSEKLQLEAENKRTINKNLNTQARNVYFELVNRDCSYKLLLYRHILLNI